MDNSPPSNRYITTDNSPSTNRHLTMDNSPSSNRHFTTDNSPSTNRHLKMDNSPSTNRHLTTSTNSWTDNSNKWIQPQVMGAFTYRGVKLHLTQNVLGTSPLNTLGMNSKHPQNLSHKHLQTWRKRQQLRHYSRLSHSMNAEYPQNPSHKQRQTWTKRHQLRHYSRLITQHEVRPPTEPKPQAETNLNKETPTETLLKTHHTAWSQTTHRTQATSRDKPEQRDNNWDTTQDYHTAWTQSTHRTQAPSRHKPEQRDTNWDTTQDSSHSMKSDHPQNPSHKQRQTWTERHQLRHYSRLITQHERRVPTEPKPQAETNLNRETPTETLLKTHHTAWSQTTHRTQATSRDKPEQRDNNWDTTQDSSHSMNSEYPQNPSHKQRQTWTKRQQPRH